MFALKKLFASLLMPLPLIMLTCMVGLLLLTCTQHRQWGITVLVVAIFALIAVSSPLSMTLLRPLEQTYKPYDSSASSPQWIVVLGSGYSYQPSLPATSELSRATLARLVEGVRIHRLYQNAQLVVTGYGGNKPVSSAKKMAEAAVTLGVMSNDIHTLENPRDTAEEATAVATLAKAAGSEHIILVTSARHMPRAMGEFQAQGLSPTPAPTDYLALANENTAWYQQLLNAQNLYITEQAWHETLGSLWQAIRLRFNTG